MKTKYLKIKSTNQRYIYNRLLAKHKRTGTHFPVVDLLNGYNISIQGGYYAYSSPKINHNGLFNYRSVEIAIFNHNNKTHSLGDGWARWFDVQKHKPFKSFLWIKDFEDGDVPVLGYVPLWKVAGIMADINSIGVPNDK